MTIKISPNGRFQGECKSSQGLTRSWVGFAGLRLRDQTVCLLKQEMEKDPVTPVPHVKLEIKPCLGQVFRLSQLERNCGMVSKVVERHRRDYVNHGAGQRRPGNAGRGATSDVDRIGVIATPQLKQGQSKGNLRIITAGLLLQ